MGVLKKISAILNDPSHPSLGPNLFFLKITCVWISERSRLKSFLYLIFHYYALLYFFSIILKLIVNFNASLLINIIQFSAFPLGIIKNLTFNKWHRRWERVVQIITELETEDDVYIKDIQSKFQYYSHLITYVYWIYGVIVTELFFIIFFYNNSSIRSDDVEYRNVFNALLPFDENSPIGRSLSIFLQMLYSSVMGAYNLGWDALVVASMVVIAGQLKMLRVRCAHSVINKNEEESLRNIYRCHRIYVKILE